MKDIKGAKKIERNPKMRQRILRKRQSEANSLARFYVHDVGCFLASSPSSSCDRVGTRSCIHMNSSWSRELQQHTISSYWDTKKLWQHCKIPIIPQCIPQPIYQILPSVYQKVWEQDSCVTKLNLATLTGLVMTADWRCGEWYFKQCLSSAEPETHCLWLLWYLW